MSNTRISVYYRTIVHPLISMLVPFFFTAFITAALAHVFAPSFRIQWWVYPFLFLIGIIEAASGTLLFKKRMPLTARIRELILIILLSYALFSVLLNQGPIQIRFFPAFNPIYITCVGAVQWMLSYMFHQRFRMREILLEIVGDKEHEPLKKAMRDSIEFVKSANLQLKSMHSIIIFCVFTSSVFMIITGYLQISYPIWVLALFFFFLWFSIMITGSINGYIEEFEHYGEGIPVPPLTQNRRYIYSSIVIVLAIVISLLSSSNRSLLPLEWVYAFLGWIAGLFDADIEPLLEDLQRQQINRPLAERFTPQEIVPEPGGEPIIDLAFIFDILKWMFGAAALVYVAIFIVKPLFSREVRQQILSVNLWELIKEKLRDILFFFRSIIQSIFSGSKGEAIHLSLSGNNPLTGEALDEQSQQMQEKIKENNRIIRGFLKVMRWGKNHKKEYRKGRTPREYISELVYTFPEIEEQGSTIYQVFQEAIFSNHVLGDTVMKSYDAAVRSITRIRSPKQRAEEPDQEAKPTNDEEAEKIDK
ncbi:MAG: hypothetical protein ACLFR1_05555 [Spirochaetia bacterium]